MEINKVYQAPTKILKELLWNKYYTKEVGCSKCFCCDTNEIMQIKFVCGHVVSRKDGGPVCVENLRPICSSCNESMSARNMREFMISCNFGKKITEDDLEKIRKIMESNTPKNICKKIIKINEPIKVKNITHIGTYSCETCEYETEVCSNYKKHLKTVKHINIVNKLSKVSVKNEDNREIPKKYICIKCQKSFNQASSLSRHKKECTIKIDANIIENKNFTEALAKHNHELIETNKKMQEKVYEMIERENKYLKTLVNEAGTMVKSSINALSFATKYYTKTPTLQKLDDYKELCPDEDNCVSVDTFIFYQRESIIAKYLGDFLIKMYKTTKPENQSMFSADVSRLNYIVRLVCGSNNNPEWCKDNNGIKIKNTIIIPMLKHVKQKITIYTKTKGEEISNCATEEIIEIVNKMGIASQISQDIDTGLIADNIIRYIAPHFSMDTHLLL